MNSLNHLHSGITEKIIKCYYTVYNKLGYGFLEKIYEKAMLIELERTGLMFTSQKTVQVYYDGIEIGKYTPDILVEDLVVVENKAAISIHTSHEDQLVNALRATRFEVGLLLNFGVVPQFKRKVSTNLYKKNMGSKINLDPL